ncbi:MAG: thiosulfate sulfurtransferase [Armatimonadetes bacterium]|nr:thiosulfate sulfurtransferase [Armatimonadota bacterium]
MKVFSSSFRRLALRPVLSVPSFCGPRVLLLPVLLLTALASLPAHRVAAQTTAFPVLDRAAVQTRLRDPNWLVVDLRDPNSYNGWALAGEPRGGHLPGAINVALAWIEKSQPRTRKRLKEQGVLGDRTLLLYGANAEQARRGADRLTRHYRVKRERIHLYEEGFSAWSADSSLPVHRLARWDRLAPAVWLAQEMRNRPELRVFDVSWGKGERYARSHIPGAVHFDTDLFEEGPIWDLLTPAQLARNFASLGITRTTPVVLYGEDPMPAARAAIVLLYAGVTDVRTLNGGLPAWVAAGYPVQEGRVPPKPVPSFGGTIPAHPELLTGIETARRMLADPNQTLADVRSWREFLGETPGYSDITARGRIAGAVWARGGTDKGSMQDYRNPDNTVRGASEIAAFLAEAGITPQKPVGFYCGTGWRAAEALLAVWLMGWERATVYEGGWYEWSANPANPFLRGDPRKKR